MRLGEYIKKARKKAGLTQKELGELLGVSGSMIGQYETGQRNPKVDTIGSIANALNISINELLEVYPPFSCSLATDEDRKDLDLLLKILNGEIKLDPIDLPRMLDEGMMKVFHQLNLEGQQVAIQRVEELTEIPKYQRETENSAKKELPPAANRKQPDDE